ncbi:LPS O-antigen length regulator [Photobacterium piscicola]|uniref:LPS O-antigen length regulator n=1 Tax=Photobacterium piscicola TaxID=1378299 RepID=A0A1T5I267_9GAMM|nr:Wzz/FepE/Etk N-terminal domain-containing protein [Photobacterium piscicola]SKC33076.1 LPS O-antigen length regulator [Photobacterium piscicola]
MNTIDSINNSRAELIKTLWRGRLTIFIMSILFISFAIFYSYRSTLLWTTATEVSINKNYFLPKNTQILLDNIATNKKTSNEIKLLFSNKNIAKEYIETIESTDNQVDFINMINSTSSKDKIKKIVIKVINNNEQYKIIINSENKKQISNLLNKYIEYSKEVANKSIITTLNHILDENKIREIVKLNRLEERAKVKINIEKKNVEYNLKIAEKIGLINPISSSNDSDFYFGSRVLSEKLEILKNIKDLSLISPEISYVTENIKSLDKVVISNKLDFYKISIMSEQSVSKANYGKNKLIIIISSVVGLFFGFSLVLIKSEFNK